MEDGGAERKLIIKAIPFVNLNPDLSQDCNLAVYYDAWENDNDEDPIISLVYEIVKQMGIKYDFAKESNIFQLAGSILEFFSGKNINTIIDTLNSESPLTTHLSNHAAIS